MLGTIKNPREEFVVEGQGTYGLECQARMTSNCAVICKLLNDSMGILPLTEAEGLLRSCCLMMEQSGVQVSQAIHHRVAVGQRRLTRSGSSVTRPNQASGKSMSPSCHGIYCRPVFTLCTGLELY